MQGLTKRTIVRFRAVTLSIVAWMSAGLAIADAQQKQLAGAGAAAIKNADAAIRRARYVCSLEQPRGPGQWQAVWGKGGWKVWFGTSPTLPECGFYGAYVKGDGSYASCEVTKCALIPARSGTRPVQKAANADWTPDTATIRKLELSVMLPDEFAPRATLAEYDRYYAGVSDRSLRLIRGEFIARGLDKKTGIHVLPISDFPLAPLDGGCAVVDLLYDPQAGRVLWIHCHGLA
jgi:hypothetical protein